MAFVLITDPEEAADMYEARVTYRAYTDSTDPPTKCVFNLSREYLLEVLRRPGSSLRLYYLTED